MRPFFGPGPMIFARRGGIPSMPGDTIEAYTAAVGAGADVINTAVRLTADGHLVIVNDGAFYAAAGEDAQVSGMNLGEIRRLDAACGFRDPVSGEFSYKGKGVKFITLEEAFTAFPSMRFNIEVMDKGSALVTALCGLVERCNAVDRLLVYSMYASTIRKVRAAMPEVATSLSLVGVAGLYALFRTGFLFLKQGFRADALQIPEIIGPSFIGNQGMIRGSSARGLKVIISVDNTPVQITRLLDAGADGFITDDVPLLIKIISEIRQNEISQS